MSNQRFNIRDDFEKVYLRSKTMERFLPKADPTILKKRQFIRSIHYIAGLYYRKYRYLYQVGGFAFEDVHSVAQLFGLAFTGCGFKGDSEHGFYTVMLNFVSQRLTQMVRWIAKKFQADELVHDQVIHAQRGMIDKLGPRPAIEEMDSEVEPMRGLPNRRILKRKLENNIPKHADKLAYYSVSKAVSGDVRRRARSFCRKYDIDYQGWAKDYLATHDCDESNFQIY